MNWPAGAPDITVWEKDTQMYSFIKTSAMLEFNNFKISKRMCFVLLIPTNEQY